MNMVWLDHVQSITVSGQGLCILTYHSGMGKAWVCSMYAMMDPVSCPQEPAVGKARQCLKVRQCPSESLEGLAMVHWQKARQEVNPVRNWHNCAYCIHAWWGLSDCDRSWDTPRTGNASTEWALNAEAWKQADTAWNGMWMSKRIEGMQNMYLNQCIIWAVATDGFQKA